MTLQEQLINNKGTVSSALSKELAKEVLNGDLGLLHDAVELVHHEAKNVRSGAAKIVEQVAEKRPELVAGNLPNLIAALDYEEPQTCWMIIHICGLCAKLASETAREVFGTVRKYLDPTHGTVLRDRAITYMGYMGAVSENDCELTFPLLIEAFEQHPDRITRILESLERMLPVMNTELCATLKPYAEKYAEAQQPGIKSRAKKVLKVLES